MIEKVLSVCSNLDQYLLEIGYDQNWWEAPTNCVGIPPTYSTLEAGLLSPPPATAQTASDCSDSPSCDRRSHCCKSTSCQ